MARGARLAAVAVLLQGCTLELGDEPVYLTHLTPLGPCGEQASHEHNGATDTIRLLERHAQVDVAARQVVGREDEHAIELTAPGSVAQALETGPVKAVAYLIEKSGG